MKRSDHGPSAVVLVEGPSDAEVVDTLARARGLPTVQIVDMGGATNIGRHLQQFARAGGVGRVTGLCDVAEERYFIRALHRHDPTVRAHVDLARHGFFTCEPDLEAELHRALGPRAVIGALDDLGDGERFRRFQHQPEWRDRPITAQLHRFAGTTSGRKIRLARHLATLLTPQTTPAPLSALLDVVERRLLGVHRPQA